MKNIFLGIVLILLGVKILLYPKFSSTSGLYFDLSGYNTPLGAAFIIYGIILIGFAIKKKKNT